MSGDATPFPQDPAAAIGADSVDATTAAPEESSPASEAPAEASDPAERVRQLEAKAILKLRLMTNYQQAA